MNVDELLELMEETLEEGTAVPFSSSKRIVDVDRMRDIIDEVRNNLPDEVRESKKSRSSRAPKPRARTSSSRLRNAPAALSPTRRSSSAPSSARSRS